MTNFTTAKLFANYTNHLVDEQEAHPDKFLGNLTWFSVPESVWVPYEDYTKLTMQLEAPVGVVLPPKPNDVFLRACTAVERAYQKLPVGDGTYRNLLIRKAGSDADWVVKQLVIETVDESEHQVGMQVAADLRFHKREFKIRLARKPGFEQGDAAEMLIEVVKAIQAYYKDKEMMLNAYAIRESIRKALDGPLLGLGVRPGVYFVAAGHGRSLARLDMLVQEIPGVQFHVLPLVDDERQREMVREAFEDEAVKELTQLMGDMDERLEKKGKITPEDLVKFQERYAELKGRNSEYREVLADELDKATATLEVTKMKIQEFFNLAVVDE